MDCGGGFRIMMFALPAILENNRKKDGFDSTKLFYCSQEKTSCSYLTDMPSDPFWANVVLYLRGEGFNGQGALNEISNPSNIPFFPSAFSNGFLTDKRSRFGNRSFQFNRSQSLVFRTAGTFNIILNDFTFECWAYVNDADVGGTFAGLVTRSDGGGATNFQLRFLAGTRRFQTQVGVVLNPLTQVTSNQWFHYAVTRQSGTIRVFVNGILNHSGTNNTAITINNLNELRIGGAGKVSSTSPNFNPFLNGFLDTIRLTTVARYNANFNPATDTFLNSTINRGSPICSIWY